jgi:hypothetical protein
MATLEELKKRHQKLLNETNNPKGGKDNNFLDKFIKLEMGKNVVRILPGKKDKMEFYAESVIHRYTDVDGREKNYHCRKTNENESCPMCDFISELWKKHRELGLPNGQKSKFGDLATKLKGNNRYYVNVIDRRLQEQNPSDNAGCVKILATGKKLMAKIINDLWDEEYLDSEDPENSTLIELENGNDFIIDLSKNGVYNSFDNSRARSKKSPAGSKQQMAAWMEVCTDLTTFVKTGDYEEGKKIVESLRASLTSAPKSEAESESDDGMSDENFNKRLEA